MKRIFLLPIVCITFLCSNELLAVIVSKTKVEVSQNNIKCYSTKETAKRFGVTEDEFHRTIKPAIIKDYLKSGQKLPCKNPDICFDGDIIILKCSEGKTFNTKMNYKSYM